MLFLLCRDVLKDLTNLSGTNEVTPKKETKILEGDCKIILSPAALGMFDLGINRAINENSPLYQELKSGMKAESSVKVETHISFSFSLFKVSSNFFIRLLAKIEPSFVSLVSFVFLIHLCSPEEVIHGLINVV